MTIGKLLLLDRKLEFEHYEKGLFLFDGRLYFKSKWYNLTGNTVYDLVTNEIVSCRNFDNGVIQIAEYTEEV